MARPDPDDLPRLERDVSLERLVSARGIALRRRRSVLTGTCPFHSGKEQTLTIDTAANTWTCGACSSEASGVVSWVMKIEGISKRHAIELLRADLVTKPPATRAGGGKRKPVVKSSTATKMASPFDAAAHDHELLGQVALYYHSTLTESPEAMAYLQSRGLGDPEMIGHFKLGYANRTLAYRLPAKNRVAGASIRGRLTTLGILRGTGHEHLNGSIVIPIFDEQNHVVGLYGRKVTPKLRSGTELHLYIGSPTAVWNLAAFTASRDMIVCGSFIDALTWWCTGHRNVTAFHDVDGFPEVLGKHLVVGGVKKVYLAFRRDDAGNAVAEKLGALLNATGIETFRVQFPQGMDGNDYVKTCGRPLDDGFGALLRNAAWTGKGASELPPAATTETDTMALGERDASIQPSVIATDAVVDPDRDEMTIRCGDRRWRVRGISKNTTYGELRVSVLVTREGVGFHLDALDMYSAKARSIFVKQAAIEIGAAEKTVKQELGTVLLELEARVDEQIRARLTPAEPLPEMSEVEREEALGLLCDPHLVERISLDFDRMGLVGEETNKLVAYVATVSRKLDEPLAVVVQSSSAAGKSSLMDAVLAMVPDEERVSYSALTGQALFYMGQRDLRHKVLSVAEGEGAARATYPLKILQSEGSLVIASTGKDGATGKLVTHEYRVTGPVMTFLTTTAIDLDPELASRCIVLTVDEGREQTRRVHVRQRAGQTLAGLLARRDRARLVRLHQNAQRLLRPLLVVNPFAEDLSFSDRSTRARRDHAKLLTLMRTVTLLHQHQRDVKTVEHGGERIDFIEVTKADVELATKLFDAVATADELPPVTAKVLAAVIALVEKRAVASGVAISDVRFTQRDVREEVGMGHTQAKLHVQRLVEMEHVRAHRLGGRAHGLAYELCGYDPSWSGDVARGRAVVGPRSGATTDSEGPRNDAERALDPVAVGAGLDRVKDDGAAQARRT